MNNLVFSNMLHRPARTVVSILGIAVGNLLSVFAESNAANTAVPINFAIELL